MRYALQNPITGQYLRDMNGHVAGFLSRPSACAAISRHPDALYLVVTHPRYAPATSYARLAHDGR